MWTIESLRGEHGGPAKQALDERSVYNNLIVTILSRRRGTPMVRTGPCGHVTVGTDNDDKVADGCSEAWTVKLLDPTGANNPLKRCSSKDQ